MLAGRKAFARCPGLAHGGLPAKYFEGMTLGLIHSPPWTLDRDLQSQRQMCGEGSRDPTN
jgi:hypothetical protein